MIDSAAASTPWQRRAVWNRAMGWKKWSISAVLPTSWLHCQLLLVLVVLVLVLVVLRAPKKKPSLLFMRAKWR